MSEFFSGIQTKNGILFDPFNDSHEHLIKKHNLNDKTRDPDFVRLEIIPIAEPWNKDPNKWVLHVDQDILPSWFSEESAKQEMWAALQTAWKETLIINEEVEELKDRSVRWIAKSHIKKMSGKSWALEVFNSTIDEMREKSSIKFVGNNSHIDAMEGESSVKMLQHFSSIRVMKENSSVEEMKEHSRVGWQTGKSIVKGMRDHSHIGTMDVKSGVMLMQNFSSVGSMCGDSRVDEMEGNSSVGTMNEYATIGTAGGQSIVRIASPNARVERRYDSATVINYAGDYPVIYASYKKRAVFLN